MRTVAELLRWRARRHPDLPAIWFQDRTRTFAELDASSSALGAGLVNDLGIQPGDRVAILDKNSDDYLELLFALDKAGAVSVPVNWRLTASEVGRVGSSCGLRICVTITIGTIPSLIMVV